MYVPAEMLAQRQHQKSIYRKPFEGPNFQHHQEISQPSTIRPNHDQYAREILYELQRQHKEKNLYYEQQRLKEMARVTAEQKEIQRLAQLHQDAVLREQELQRQRLAAKQKKETELKEKQRLEQERLAEIRAKEEKRRSELDRLAALQREKDRHNQEQRLQREKEHNRQLEEQRVQEARLRAQNQINSQQDQLESQIHHQHLTETTSKPLRSNQIAGHYLQQQEFAEMNENPTTTPSPNQPPLSVYMGSLSSNEGRYVKLVDVLKTLRDAKRISVLDSYGPDTPRVFVGPRGLDPPGYAKFDLPYLSSLDSNRVERKVDKLPFFVAPLSFEPPNGYSKIPFPAPHIGSVVINNLENISGTKFDDSQGPSPNPLIEPNSYISSHSTPAYKITTIGPYSQEPSTTPSYHQTSYTKSQPIDRFRYTIGQTKSPLDVTVQTTPAYSDERNEFDRIQKQKAVQVNQQPAPTTPDYYSPKTISAFSFEQSIPQSTPSYHHQVNPHVNDYYNQGHHEIYNNYHEQQRHPLQRYPVDPNGQHLTNTYYLRGQTNYDGQTDYNLPSHLPAISPQLPGLVNALVEKTETPIFLPTPEQTTTTTTTTTTEIPTTTRSRLRNR